MAGYSRPVIRLVMISALLRNPAASVTKRISQDSARIPPAQSAACTTALPGPPESNRFPQIALHPAQSKDPQVSSRHQPQAGDHHTIHSDSPILNEKKKVSGMG